MESNQLFLLFIPILMLISGILLVNKNFMFGIDNYLINLSDKYNKKIDKTDYCRFEGMEKIIFATSLLTVLLFCLTFNIGYKIQIVMMLILLVIDTVRYLIKRKKILNQFPPKENHSSNLE